jgi:hypothetical protein
MNERIKNLYDLFLQAKEKGHNITFRHGRIIDVCLFDKEQNLIEIKYITLDSPLVNFYFRGTEQFLNYLIGSDVQ